VNLDGIGAHPLRHFRGEQLGHGRFLDARLAGVFQLRCRVHEPAGGLDAGRHIGEPKGDCLVFHDRRAEGLALAGIGKGCVVSGARHADGLRGDADSAGLQIGESNFVTLPFITQHQVRGELHVFEDDLTGIGAALAELFFDAGDAIAARVRRHQEGADAVFVCISVGDGKHHGHIRDGAGGDKLLGTVQEEFVAAAFGAGAQIRGIRPRLGLGETERAEHPALRERLEEARLLRIGAEGLNRGAHGRVVDVHDGRDTAVTGRDLLDRKNIGNEIGAGASPALRNRHAEQPERSHFREDLAGDAGFTVPGGRIGRQARGSKVARHVANHALLLAENHCSGFGPLPG
jgi:hypothetical protein